MVWKGASRTSTTTGSTPFVLSGVPVVTFTAPNTPIWKTRRWASFIARSLYQSPLRIAPCAWSMMNLTSTEGRAPVATKMFPNLNRMPGVMRIRISAVWSVLSTNASPFTCASAYPSSRSALVTSRFTPCHCSSRKISPTLIGMLRRTRRWKSSGSSSSPSTSIRLILVGLPSFTVTVRATASPSCFTFSSTTCAW